MLGKDLEQDKKGNQEESRPDELVARQFRRRYSACDGTQGTRDDSGRRAAQGDGCFGGRISAVWLSTVHGTLKNEANRRWRAPSWQMWASWSTLDRKWLTA